MHIPILFLFSCQRFDNQGIPGNPFRAVIIHYDRIDTSQTNTVNLPIRSYSWIESAMLNFVEKIIFSHIKIKTFNITRIRSGIQGFPEQPGGLHIQNKHLRTWDIITASGIRKREVTREEPIDTVRNEYKNTATHRIINAPREVPAGNGRPGLFTRDKSGTRILRIYRINIFGQS